MADARRPTGFSLRRWSQRKLAAGRRDAHSHPDDRAPVSAAQPDAPRPIAFVPATNLEQAAMRAHPTGSALPRSAEASPVAPAPPVARTGNAVELPPLESLTIDSDFSPFMQAGVDEDLKRSALRRLLRDPQFNVMDGLDVYIDDYSKPSPLEPELARALMQARYIFDPPRTRVNAEGIVEDVPDGEDAVGVDDTETGGTPPPRTPVAVEASAGAKLPGEPGSAGAEAAVFVPSAAANAR